MPLAPWGHFTGQRRVSESPYVESVWGGLSSRDGIHLTAADGTIDLTLRKRRGVTRMLLSGPTSRARVTRFEAGDEVIAIRLRTGIHLPFARGPKLTDLDQILPIASKRHFWLQSEAVEFPSFDNVEAFAERLVKSGLLQRDPVVESVLAGRFSHLGRRTIQRHFLAATGMPLAHIKQIRRAEQARALLSSDYSLTTIAYETGYSNPGHMTNAFKYFFGQSPSALRATMSR